MRVLIVEDDEKLNNIICKYLMKRGYQVDGFTSSSQALDSFGENNFDLVISDVMMPEIDGFELAEYVRRENRNIPILFITALDDFGSKKRGFQLGIDDYMVKPIDLDELVLRVGALLRRASAEQTKELLIGSLRLVSDEKMAYVGADEVELLPREFDILYKLLAHPKKIFTRSDLLNEYWGQATDTGLRTVDVYITRLRKKFETCDEFEIQTVHGLGYKAVLRK